MCGIAAVLLQPRPRTPDQFGTIRDIFTRNLVLNEERGSEATGCAIVQCDGRIGVAKEAVPASAFVSRAVFRNLMKSVDAATTLILGHTRQPTKGTPFVQSNNHPLWVGSVVGAHNGHVSNDDLLFARCRYPREAEVDSEIIFRMLASVPHIGEGSGYLRAVRPRLQQLEGQYTFLACDERSPGRLLALRHTHPLCLHYEPDCQALFFSSSYSFLRRVFGPAVAAEDLTPDHLLLFDAEAIPELGNQPFASLEMDAGGTSDGE